VKRAENWKWGSLYHWKQGSTEPQPLLSPWPQRRKPGWAAHVNQPLTANEQQALAHSIQRGAPFGDDAWTTQTVKQLDLESTVKPRGRPRKAEKGS
tara:strand:+ start:1394 stop:1681 length:288 start_codon:yes stop_codon:yes gene_type:complete